ncbi:hypothetical protein LY76DRAFT_251077 [Colletotrichum caudatum]|nr:hypothetical protein LY76DRAFT_251077 [Colletotrichum caudatum]
MTPILFFNISYSPFYRCTGEPFRSRLCCSRQADPTLIHSQSFSRDSVAHISPGGSLHRPMDVPWEQLMTPQLLLNQRAEWLTEGTLAFLGIGVIAHPLFFSFHPIFICFIVLLSSSSGPLPITRVSLALPKYPAFSPTRLPPLDSAFPLS